MADAGGASGRCRASWRARSRCWRAQRSSCTARGGRTRASTPRRRWRACTSGARSTPEKSARRRVNGNLARDVRVIEARQASEDFHARFRRAGKTYCYRVFNERFTSPFWSRYALHEARPLDTERMRDAARLFVGQHDWTAFSAAQSDVKTRVRELSRELEISEHHSERGPRASHRDHGERRRLPALHGALDRGRAPGRRARRN